MAKLHLNKGFILIDCCVGICLFMTTFIAASQCLTLFFQTTASVAQHNENLTTGIHVLPTLRGGIATTNVSLTLLPFDATFKKAQFQTQSGSLELLVRNPL